MKEKIAFVVQRYGLEVNGGSESECRLYAEALTKVFDVEVYTSCALDHITWANSYTPGTEQINGVTVHRFASKKVRKLSSWNRINSYVLTNPQHTDADEEKWIDEVGPFCPELLEVLYQRQDEYKVILFETYLYYPTIRGLAMNFRNALLIPTVHDEPEVYLRCFDRVFDAAKGFIWNTPEEKAFAEQRFPSIKGKPGVIVGCGVSIPDIDLPELPNKLRNTEYIVYTGRIDGAKGCAEMFRAFTAYKTRNPGNLKLVLMGKATIDIPKSPDIISLGFVSEEMKYSVMKSAKALVLFSHLESFSIVVIESLLMGRPVLVNGTCAVLKGHCIRSNAGLYFENGPEFIEALNYLMTHPAEYEAMCKNGVKYVKENYRWETITDKICGLIRDFDSAE